MSRKLVAPGTGTLVREVCTNFVISSFFALFAWSFVDAFLSTGRTSLLLFVVKESLDALFYFCRKVPKEVTVSLSSWGCAIGGTLAPLLMRPAGVGDYTAFSVLQYGGVTLQIVAILSLNRSFGIVPANRGIKMRGMYRLVRHPLYACYGLALLGFLLNNLSADNLILFCAATVFQVLRVQREEELLSRDDEYRLYQSRTKWKLVPFLF